MKMAASEVYKHASIDFKSREIRLIELLDGPESEPLSCKFHRCHLEAPLEYTALSYTWGNTMSPKHEILIDDIPVCIRQNLWDFLQEARRSYRLEFLWIDAICINQSNTDERNHQVGLMGDIYTMVICDKYLRQTWLILILYRRPS